MQAAPSVDNYIHLLPSGESLKGKENTFFHEGELAKKTFKAVPEGNTIGVLRGSLQDLNLIRPFLAEGREVSVWTDETTLGGRGIGGSIVRRSTVKEVRVETFDLEHLLVFPILIVGPNRTFQLLVDKEDKFFMETPSEAIKAQKATENYEESDEATDANGPPSFLDTAKDFFSRIAGKGNFAKVTYEGCGNDIDTSEGQFPMDTVRAINVVAIKAVLDNGKELPKSLTSRATVLSLGAGIFAEMPRDGNIDNRIDSFFEAHRKIVDNVQNREIIRQLILKNAFPTLASRGRLFCERALLLAIFVVFIGAWFFAGKELPAKV